MCVINKNSVPAYLPFNYRYDFADTAVSRVHFESINNSCKIFLLQFAMQRRESLLTADFIYLLLALPATSSAWNFYFAHNLEFIKSLHITHTRSTTSTSSFLFNVDHYIEDSLFKVGRIHSQTTIISE